MDLKKPISFDEQIIRLKNNGMLIADEEQAKRILKIVNYYRFSGYALQFRINPQISQYKNGTTFECVYNLYKFDEKLRDLFRMYVEKAEIYYRTQIAYGFSMIKCLNPPHDQHYDKANYYCQKGFEEILENFKKEKGYYKDSLIVEHHNKKYASKMPLWVMVELMSFADISKLYCAMYRSEKQAIANAVGVSAQTLENHLHCLSVLRNKCAHAARLYNTDFNPPAHFTTTFLRKNPKMKNNSLFAYALVLLKRLPDAESKKDYVAALSTVIEQHKGDIDMALIGFPKKYLEILNNNL